MFLAHYGHPEAADVTRKLNLNCSLHSIGFNGGCNVWFRGVSKATRRLLSGAGGGAFFLNIYIIYSPVGSLFQLVLIAVIKTYIPIRCLVVMSPR